MNKFLYSFLLAILVVLSSCNPKVATSLIKSYPPLSQDEKVVVFDINDPEPPGAEFLGQVKIGDTGFTTKCDYCTVLKKAEQEAGKVGGNAIKIVSHRYPGDGLCTCHRIIAKILRVDNPEKYFDKKEENLYKDSSLINSDGYNQYEPVRKPYKQYMVAIKGGYSYEISKVSDDLPGYLEDYVEDIKSGYHFGGDIAYFFNESLGIGLKYVQFNSSNKMYDTSVPDPFGNWHYGADLKDDIRVIYWGPSFWVRFPVKNNRNSLSMSVALGPIDYTDNKRIIDKYKITGNTLGLSYDLGYNVGISQNLSLDFRISFLFGELSEYKVKCGSYSEKYDLDDDDYEGLSRLDLSIGLIFNK